MLQGFALVNGALVVVWMVLAWRVGRHYIALTTSGSSPAAAA
jgi:hypothetical protein